MRVTFRDKPTTHMGQQSCRLQSCETTAESLLSFSQQASIDNKPGARLAIVPRQAPSTSATITLLFSLRSSWSMMIMDLIVLVSQLIFVHPWELLGRLL